MTRDDRTIDLARIFGVDISLCINDMVVASEEAS